MKYLANIITSTRIILSLTLIWLEPFVIEFIIIYILCGISDMVDGFIARKTETTSSFGERLDSVSDIIFLVIVFYKIVPVLHLSPWHFISIILIGMIRIYNMIFSYIRYKKICLMHTKANKITGFMLFLLPLIMNIKFSFDGMFIMLCIVATYASIQEGYFLRKSMKSGSFS